MLYGLRLDWNMQMFVFIAIMLACLVKVPLVPFHAWLPLAYYEAPASATALMAGALSKMGAYGILKLALPLAPDVAVAAGPAMAALAVASLLYGAVLALREEDYKKLIAYSSLSHMGYIVLGLFSLREVAIHGALLQMLSHGVAVAGLFALLGMLEQRLGPAYRHATALSTAAPRFAIWLMLFVLTTVALPLTSGFTAEFLILFGAFAQGLAAWQAHAGSLLLIVALLAMTGMVLGATYMLRFARAILFGADTGAHRIADLRPAEAAWLSSAPAGDPRHRRRARGRHEQGAIRRRAARAAAHAGGARAARCARGGKRREHAWQVTSPTVSFPTICCSRLLLVLMLLETIGARERIASPLLRLALLGGCAVLWQQFATGYAAEPLPGEVRIDRFAVLAKLVILACGLLWSLVFPRGTYKSAFLAGSSLLGALVIMDSAGFILLFMGIEMLSLPAFALIVHGAGRGAAAEGAFKYLLLSAVASASMLFGIALGYGATGSLAIAPFADAVHAGAPPAVAAGLLVASGLFLKAAVFPFHGWAPDAYSGARLQVTGLLASVVKGAVILALVRIFGTVGLNAETTAVIVVLAMLSIFYGNFAAITAAQLQAAHRLLVDRPRRIHGVRARRYDRRPRQRPPLVRRDLRLDGDRRLRRVRRAVPGRGRRRAGARRRLSRASGDRPRVRARDALARGHPAAARLLREAVRVHVRRGVGLSGRRRRGVHRQLHRRNLLPCAVLPPLRGRRADRAGRLSPLRGEP